MRASPATRRMAGFAAVFAIAGGTITLIGWGIQKQILTDWGNTGISMFPNAALCSIFVGVALLLSLSKNPTATAAAIAFSVIPAAIGGLTLLEHLTGISFGIDTLIAKRPWGQAAAAAPMRMGPPAALSFTLMAAAVVLAVVKPLRKLSPLFGLAVIAIALLSFTGYLYGAEEMYSFPRLTGIALQTASILLVLGVGVVASISDSEPMRVLLDEGAAGKLARRALPTLLVLSLTLGGFRVLLEKEGLADASFGTALRTLLEIIVLGWLLWRAALMVRSHERALRESEAEVRRQAAQLQLAKDEAEKANAAKDHFMASLSHELRTPLMPVMASLGAWDMDQTFPPDLRPDLAMIRRNVDLEARLIDDLLDLTRIINGKLVLHREVLNVHALIDSVVSIYRDDIAAKNLQLTVDLKATDHYVRADSGRLQQVFWNVLKNATKFTPSGGTITISTRNEKSGEIQIVVCDNGIGISQETLSRIFKPFEQGGIDVAKQFGGVGLGLAIAKSLVDAQEGQIRAESDGPGCGARFTISFPIAQKPAETPVQATPSVKSARPIRLLLVEDHVDTAKVMERLLRGNGHEVSVAGNVQEALDAVRRQRFDVIISDLGLPDGSGLDLIREIRQQRGESTPAVALTGYGMEDDVARCMEAGFSAHLTKPVNLQRLEATLQMLTADVDRAAGKDAIREVPAQAGLALGRCDATCES